MDKAHGERGRAVIGLVGIHGLKGSGKDTVAKMICREILQIEGRESRITHYADTLKRSASALFGVDIEWFYDEKKKETTIHGLNMTPRQIMTDLHDVLIPKFGQDLFVSPVRNEYSEWISTDWGKDVQSQGPFIIADVRYDPRETAWVREWGGVILHVVRKSVQRGSPASRHSSEQGIPMTKEDYVIHNEGTLEDLQRTVAMVVAELRGYS